VLLGVFTSILMEIIGVPALAFAVGMYLPLEATTPVFIGGLARKLVDWKRGSEAESDAGPGVLFSSGLVAGGSILGLAAAMLNFDKPWVERLRDRLAFGGGNLLSSVAHGETVTTLVGFGLFLSLAYMTYWFATRPQKE
jgi:hypothetical protein